MQNNLIRKGLVFTIVVLFVGASVVPLIGGATVEKQDSTDNKTSFMGFNPRGDTLYVGGSGPGNYSKIQDAIDNASNGDTVFVYSGWYNENIVADRTINLIGEYRDTTVINGSGHGGYSVILIDADWVNITGFNITNGWGGIESADHNNITVTENTIYNSGWPIILSYSNNNIISNNIIIKNGQNILLESSSDNIISGNIIRDNNDGIMLLLSNNTAIVGNNITNNYAWAAISLQVSSNNTVLGNTIKNNGDYGIYLFDSLNCSIIENTIAHHNEYGVILTAETMGRGVTFHFNHSMVGDTVANNTIMKNVFLDNGYIEISLEDSSNCIISENTITTGEWHGIRLRNSYSNTISRNNITTNKYNNWQTGIILEFSSSDNIITKNHVTNSTNGIWLEFSSNNNIVSRNNISNIDGAGIHLQNSCKNNNITDNNIRINNTSSQVSGISLSSHCEYNFITWNTVTNGDRGIMAMQSFHNNFSFNYIANCNYGFYFRTCNNNTLYMNTIIDCNTSIHMWSDPPGRLIETQVDIYEIGIQPNVIKKNNFINSKFHVIFKFYTYIGSHWDGNYWGRPRLLPKLIIGFRMITENFGIPARLQFDWHPAKQPYEIKGGN